MQQTPPLAFRNPFPDPNDNRKAVRFTGKDPNIAERLLPDRHALATGDNMNLGKTLVNNHRRAIRQGNVACQQGIVWREVDFEGSDRAVGINGIPPLQFHESLP